MFNQRESWDAWVPFLAACVGGTMVSLILSLYTVCGFYSVHNLTDKIYKSTVCTRSSHFHLSVLGEGSLFCCYSCGLHHFLNKGLLDVSLIQFKGIFKEAAVVVQTLMSTEINAELYRREVVMLLHWHYYCMLQLDLWLNTKHGLLSYSWVPSRFSLFFPPLHTNKLINK